MSKKAPEEGRKLMPLAQLQKKHGEK